MFKGASFGITNGIITILSILVGMYSVNASKLSVIGAFLAILISDPLSDAYAIYIAEKDDNSEHAYTIGKDAFLSQFILQALFLIIIICCPTVSMGVVVSIITSIIILIVYSIKKQLKMKEVLYNFIGIAVLISITYASDRGVYHFFKNKNK